MSGVLEGVTAFCDYCMKTATIEREVRRNGDHVVFQRVCPDHERVRPPSLVIPCAECLVKEAEFWGLCPTCSGLVSETTKGGDRG